MDSTGSMRLKRVRSCLEWSLYNCTAISNESSLLYSMQIQLVLHLQSGTDIEMTHIEIPSTPHQRNPLHLEEGNIHRSNHNLLESVC
jgi:hypothetical protein